MYPSHAKNAFFATSKTPVTFQERIDRNVRVDQGAAHHCRHLVDGGYALSAAAVRLSLRGRTRLKAVRNLQDDGTPAFEGDHQSRDERHLARRALSGLVRAL